MNDMVKNIAQNWSSLSPLLAVPRTENEYDARVELMNQLIDEIGEDETHPLARLLDTVGALVAHYEASHYPLSDVPAQNVLAYLMEDHHLTQSQLPEVGSQGVVSEILRGKRQLNTRQIQAVSQRFGVSPSVFFNSVSTR